MRPSCQLGQRESLRKYGNHRAICGAGERPALFMADDTNRVARDSTEELSAGLNQGKIGINDSRERPALIKADDTMKKCITCELDKSFNEFYNSKNECKKCKNKRSMDHYLQHKNELGIYNSQVCRQPEILLKFMKSIEFKTDCWIYTRGKDRKKYGRFYIGRKSLGAHRVSYLIFKGDIDDGLFVCHTCDNPSCVNPQHLWLGTTQKNTEDMMKKGRLKTPFSNGHKKGGRPKLK